VLCELCSFDMQLFFYSFFADDSDLVLERGEGVDGPNLSLMVLMVRSQPDGLRLMMLDTGPNRSLIARPKASDSVIELPRGKTIRALKGKICWLFSVVMYISS
jgi:hypothetical protein